MPVLHLDHAGEEDDGVGDLIAAGLELQQRALVGGSSSSRRAGDRLDVVLDPREWMQGAVRRAPGVAR